MHLEKVLIIVPPLVQRKKNQDSPYQYLDFEYFRLISPIEPATMAADLYKRGFEPLIFDLGACSENPDVELEAKLSEFTPDAVIIANAVLTFGSSFDYNGKECFDLVRRINPLCVTVLTGTHATNFPGQAVEEAICDYSIAGEPDLVTGELLDAIRSGDTTDLNIAGLTYKQGSTVIRSSVFPAVDLSTIPLPAYNFIDWSQVGNYSRFLEYGKIRFPEKSSQYRDIITSRGCILNCCFCNVSHLRGRQSFRRKPLEMVIDEIKSALQDGIEEIHFFDDLFAENEEQIFRFTDLLVKNNLKFPWFVAQGMPLWPLSYDALAAMKETGMYRIICPFESGSNRVLHKVVAKRTTVEHNSAVIEWAGMLDLEVIGLFVVGIPGETRSELLQTVHFAENHPGIDYSVFSIATPLVNTRMTNQAVEKGIYSDTGQLNTVIKRTVGLYHTEAFSEVELGIIRAYDWNRINFSTPKRCEKYARMVGVSLEQLGKLREYSLQTFGHFFPDYNGPLSFAELCQSGGETIKTS